MLRRLRNGLVLAGVAGALTGVAAAVANRVSRAFAAQREPEFVSLPHPREAALTGPELLARAEELVLDALRSEPASGLTNADVGALTGLNPRVGQRSGEVTRTILNSLVERGMAYKDGQRYTASRRF